MNKPPLLSVDPGAKIHIRGERLYIYLTRQLAKTRSSSFLDLPETMVSRAGLYTFIYGTRIDDADPPPLLRLRASSSFIIATIVIAVFTVRITCPHTVILNALLII